MDMTTAIDTREPLRQLRRVIEAIDDDLLHMRVFSERAPCGTAYCAAGAAAADPWFRAHTRIGDVLRVGDEGDISIASPGYELIGPLAEVFHITSANATALFAFGAPTHLGAHDVTKAEVLANIDALLDGQGATPYAAMDDDDDDWDAEDDDDAD